MASDWWNKWIDYIQVMMIIVGMLMVVLMMMMIRKSEKICSEAHFRPPRSHRCLKTSPQAVFRRHRHCPPWSLHQPATRPPRSSQEQMRSPWWATTSTQRASAHLLSPPTLSLILLPVLFPPFRGPRKPSKQPPSHRPARPLIPSTHHQPLHFRPQPLLHHHHHLSTIHHLSFFHARWYMRLNVFKHLEPV